MPDAISPLAYLADDAPARPDFADVRLTVMPSGLSPARPALPFQGLTVLAVEDSRFASEALRLLCHRSGARLRRTETLEAARRHLRVYRPEIVIIDLGLPDGRGEDLIRDLALRMPTGTVILGTSGAPEGRVAAIAAGAHGFLEKPVAGLAAFQEVLLHHLPDRRAPLAQEAGGLRPDRLALSEDLAHAARLIADGPSPPQQRYLAGFVGGLARHSGDVALEQAAGAAREGQAGLDRLAALLGHRLTEPPEPFAAP